MEATDIRRENKILKGFNTDANSVYYYCKTVLQPALNSNEWTRHANVMKLPTILNENKVNNTLHQIIHLS